MYPCPSRGVNGRNEWSGRPDATVSEEREPSRVTLPQPRRRTSSPSPSSREVAGSDGWSGTESESGLPTPPRAHGGSVPSPKKAPCDPGAGSRFLQKVDDGGPKATKRGERGKEDAKPPLCPPADSLVRRWTGSGGGRRVSGKASTPAPEPSTPEAPAGVGRDPRTDPKEVAVVRPPPRRRAFPEPGPLVRRRTPHTFPPSTVETPAGSGVRFGSRCRVRGRGVVRVGPTVPSPGPA